MTAPARNLVNLHSVEKGYGTRSVLRGVTLGLAEGDRVGIVGRNGEGKSTLLRLIAGAEDARRGHADAHRRRRDGPARPGRRPRRRRARSARSSSAGGPTTSGPATARSVPCSTASSAASGSSASRPGSTRRSRRCRAASDGASRSPARCSAAPTCCCSTSRRTTSTSRGSTGSPGTSPPGAGRSSSSPMTAGSSTRSAPPTWEVGDGAVHQYEGGYAAYVLARAERDRQAAAREDRRRQLVRKELAWLRRGPPARTSKPKFRIEAANALIADEPAPRDRVELLRFATARLGGKVLEAEDVSVAFGDRVILRDATWRLGPGDRVAVVGANGSGKTTLVDVLAGERAPDAGEVQRGATVRLAHLSQDTVEIPGHLRVLEALQEIRGRIRARRRQRADRRPARRALRLPRRPRPHAGPRPLRRRAPSPAAHAPADGRAERAAARRADERPRHRHAHRARGPPRRLARHARRRQPRPLVRGARVRRRVRARRRGRDPPSARAGSTSTCSESRAAAEEATAPRARPRTRRRGPRARSSARRARRWRASSARSTG